MEKGIIGIPDEELIIRYRDNRDTAAVASLFERHSHRVLGLAMHYMRDRTKAEDMTMEVFEKASCFSLESLNRI